MKKNKYISSLTGFFSFSYFLSACASVINNNPETLIINVKQNYDDASTITNFQNYLNQQIAKYKKTTEYENVSLKKVQINVVSDNQTILDNVALNKSQFGYVASYNLYAYNNKKLLTPKIQTLTNAFKGDTNITFYNNQIDDQLQTTSINLEQNNQGLHDVAQKINHYFHTPSYAQWGLTTNLQKWNGSVYTNLYELNQPINYYRGMIMFKGTEEDYQEITKAWNQKNWSAFLRSVKGFAGEGQNTSGSYLLQEKLLLKHFNLKHTSLQQEIIKHQILEYKQMKARDLANRAYDDYHLFFDDLGSYAWTQNKDTTGSHPIYYSPQKSNQQIQVWMVTNPLLYDVGVFNHNLNPQTQKLLSQIIIQSVQDQQDPYGPSYGYNNYQLITNVNQEFDDWMAQTLQN